MNWLSFFIGVGAGAFVIAALGCVFLYKIAFRPYD